MSKFLTQIFSIENHPVKELDYNIRLQYVMGLCEFVFHITDSSDKGKIVCMAWGKSILGEEIPDSFWTKTERFSHVKNAIKIKRSGFKFFTMRKFFYFDCFYLLEKSCCNERLEDAFEFLDKQICGYFSRKRLPYIWRIFSHSLIDSVISFVETSIDDHYMPIVLCEHRESDKKFHKKKLKRVLVVATMSAGKSTLINALTGYKLNKAQNTACTSKLVYLYNKRTADGITYEIENEDYMHKCEIKDISNDFTSAAFHFDSELASERICFIDTPGVNYALDNKHEGITCTAIKDNEYDVVLFVSNATQFATNDEDKLLEYVVKNSKKKIIFAINQLDRFKESEDSVEDIIASFQERLRKKGLKKSPVVAVSALAGMLFKMDSNGQTMDEDETFDLSLFNRKFKKPFYNFSIYNNKKTNIGISDTTGIKFLEKTIMNI